MKKTFAKIMMSVVFISLISASVYAQEQKQKEKVIAKELAGIVSGISNNFIAVTNGIDPVASIGQESAFNLDKNVRVIHKNDLKEINVGDTVSVSYEQVVTIQPDKTKSYTTRVKSITFLSPGPGAVSQPATASPSGDSSSAQSDELLPLKGLKGR